MLIKRMCISNTPYLQREDLVAEAPGPRRIKRDKYRKLLEYRITGINIFDAQGDRKASRLPYSESEE
jgi:hypothetical protein